MGKIAYVKFVRTVVVDGDVEDLDLSKMSEEEIVEKACEIWNEDMELDDIMMDEEHAVSVRIEEE